jgi:undecaprenyl-diphosphatase
VIPFDSSLIRFLNQYAHRSWAFDNAVYIISNNALLKGSLVTALIWWAWFRQDGRTRQRRETLLFGIVACPLALMLARLMAHLLPFRERPLRNPLLGFQLPYEMNDTILIRWSSFPSDHAVLFFTLAAILFFVSRRAGIIAFCHTVFIICLPRVYLGIHYPSDILAGAIIGIGIASLSKIPSLRTRFTRPGFLWLQKSPDTFYASLFLVTFQIAVLVEPARELLTIVSTVPRSLLTASLGVLMLVLVLLRIRALMRPASATSRVLPSANFASDFKTRTPNNSASGTQQARTAARLRV